MGDESRTAFVLERRRALGLADVVTSIPGAPQPFRFNGPAYETKLDRGRLSGQILRIFTLMRDRVWRTLPEIAAVTADPEASISAQLRHLRKQRFGAHTIARRRRGADSAGLWEYRLTVNPGLADG